jgi:hypothetical protein
MRELLTMRTRARPSPRSLVTLPCLSLAILAAVGCTPDASRAYCEKYCECAEEATSEACPSEYVDACTRERDSFGKFADDSGCRAEYDEFLLCYADADDCGGAGCEEESLAYSECEFDAYCESNPEEPDCQGR